MSRGKDGTGSLVPTVVELPCSSALPSPDHPRFAPESVITVETIPGFFGNQFEQLAAGDVDDHGLNGSPKAHDAAVVSFLAVHDHAEDGRGFLVLVPEAGGCGERDGAFGNGVLDRCLSVSP